MSNPVSLYCEDLDALITELSSEDVVDCERPPTFRDYLSGEDSDFYTMILAELYEAHRDKLKFHPSDRLLRVILWSWLDDAGPTIDIPRGQAEELGLDLAITPTTIQKLDSEILGFSPLQISAAIFDANDAWSDPNALAIYLNRWLSVFNDAKIKGKGVYYKIWV